MLKGPHTFLIFNFKKISGYPIGVITIEYEMEILEIDG